MNVTLIYFDGCPHWMSADRTLVELTAEFDLDITRKRISSPTEAEQTRFRGSPTILIDGLDPFADPDASTGLSCRLYNTPEGLRGSPTSDMLRAVLRQS